jgi:biotin operon repressor
MSEAVKNAVLKMLKDRANNWVPQNLIQKSLGKEDRFAPAIAQLRKEGHEIANKHDSVNGKQMWEYMLVVRKLSVAPGWYCGSCNSHIAPTGMQANTLSERHSRNYCVSCARKRIFTLR